MSDQTPSVAITSASCDISSKMTRDEPKREQACAGQPSMALPEHNPPEHNPTAFNRKNP